MGPKRKVKDIPPVTGTRSRRGVKPQKSEPPGIKPQKSEPPGVKTQKSEPPGDKPQKPEPEQKIATRGRKRIQKLSESSTEELIVKKPYRSVKSSKSAVISKVEEPKVQQPQPESIEPPFTNIRTKPGLKRKETERFIQDKDVLDILEDNLTNPEIHVDDVKVGARRKRGMKKPTGEESPAKKHALGRTGSKVVIFTDEKHASLRLHFDKLTTIFQTLNVNRTYTIKNSKGNLSEFRYLFFSSVLAQVKHDE